MTLVNDQPEQGGRGVPASAEAPERDEVARLDGRLKLELSKVNYQLSRYVLKLLDADAGHGEPVPLAEELALASCLASAADAIRTRAERRKQDPPGTELAEGDSR
ncbi:MAG TPA: hypothetical protein VMS31_12045 [Pyrinomonadaceae bacterium]|nr:hypothetical protein [Pyrinomonadaceae bacterium]